MAAAAPETPLELNDEQRQTTTALGKQIGTLVLVLGLLALVRLVHGVLRFKTDKLLAILDIVEGLTTGFMALVLLNARDSAAFMAEVKGYEKTHFLNLTSNFSVYAKVLIALGVLVGLVSLLRLVM